MINNLDVAVVNPSQVQVNPNVNFKINQMKKLLFVLALLSLVSCGPNKPDSKEHGVKVEQSGFVPGATVKDAPVAVYDTLIMISPTWGQANHFAREKQGHTLWTIVGWVLFLTFLVAIYGKATEASWFPNITPTSYNLSLGLLLALSVLAWKGVAADIKWNNDKWVKREVFRKAIEQTGTTQPIWDSLDNNCLIVGGKYDCYKK